MKHIKIKLMLNAEFADLAQAVLKSTACT